MCLLVDEGGVTQEARRGAETARPKKKKQAGSRMLL
jgi:hypothetical protein